jgi:SAM-dependent methyltransferase
MSKKDWFQAFDSELWLQGDEDAEVQAAFIRKVLGLRKGRTVLDAPCGDGRIAVPLAEAGLLVMGIDHNPYFLERARARFEEGELEGEFFVGDIREISLLGCFHGAFNWGGSFGYFSDEENLETLRRLARAVRPGGRVLVDQPNREYVLRHFVKERRHGPLTVVNCWNARRQRIESQWTLRRRGSKHTYSMAIRLYTPVQMRRLFKQVGLKVEAAYGGPDGKKFRRTSHRLILVGRKTKK